MRRYIWMMLLLSFSTIINAETYVHLTNNTNTVLKVSVDVNGDTPLIHGEHYQQLAHKVPPLATVKVLKMNRDKGIKKNKAYYFSTNIEGASSRLTLQQKLIGTPTFSKMWLSAATDEIDLPWYYDRDIHQQHLSFDHTESTFAFRSQKARASGDDLYYVIHNNWNNPKPEQSNKLRVLTYNTWVLLPPLESKKSSPRLDEISEVIKGYDVIVFQEVFDLIKRNNFIEKISSEFPYRTKIVGKVLHGGKILDGGIFIASRWPIKAEDQLVYNTCRKDGCLAAKGVSYARIDKMGNIYNIFGTHTHAYTSDKDIAVRSQQLSELRTFIDSKQIPSDEPVLIAGDLNVDKINFPGEHAQMLTTLNASEPEAKGKHQYSYDGELNSWAKNHREYLDYILYSNNHLHPSSSNNSLLTPRSIKADLWGYWDLSDHYPVEGDFTFPTTAVDPEEDDGYRQISMNGLCLDGGSVINLSHTSLQQCTGQDNQLWQLTADGSIRNKKKPTRCLDGMGVLNGTRLIIWDCHGGSNQRWTIDGSFIRSKKNSNKVIDAYKTHEGGGVGIWSFHGEENQQWLWQKQS